MIDALRATENHGARCGVQNAQRGCVVLHLLLGVTSPCPCVQLWEDSRAVSPTRSPCAAPASPEPPRQGGNQCAPTKNSAVYTQKDTKNPVGYTQVHDRNKSTTQKHEEPPLQGSEPKPTLSTRAAWEQVGQRECKCCAKATGHDVINPSCATTSSTYP